MLEKIALQKGFISKEDAQRAIAACRDAEDFDKALKEYFLSNEILTPPQLNQMIHTLAVVKTMKKTVRFGEIAIKLGYMSKDLLQSVINRQKKIFAQKKQPKSIGQILFDAGKLTRDQVEQVFKVQKEEAKKTTESDRGAAEDSVETEEPSENRSIEIDGGMILEIDADHLAAYLRKTDEFKDTIDVEDIYDILSANRIIFGLAGEEMINGFIKSSGFKTNAFRVATGKTRVMGMDARIEYYFDTDYLKAGGMDEEGNIDFKDRGIIPKVEEGTLLARKFPAVEPKSGRNIYGEELEILPVKDVELRSQTGTRFSDDGLKIYADTSGYPRLTWTGHINVLADFIVDGDVNYQTGHVNYDGDIHIKGCLKSGFNVTGRNIKIFEVDGGVIEADGNVTITNGINNATILSRGHVNAKYIHNAEIACLGNLNVEKEIVDSRIEISGTCNIKTGEIINCIVSCNKGVIAKNLGTSKTAPNNIQVGIDQYTKEELKGIEKKIEQIHLQKEMLGKKREKLTQEKSRARETAVRLANEIEKCRHDTRVTEKNIAKIENPDKQKREAKALKRELMQNESLFRRLQREMNKCFDTVEANNITLKDITDQLDDFEENLQDLASEKEHLTEWGKANPGNAEVIAGGTIFSDTSIKGAHSQLELKENMTRVRIKEGLLQNTGGSHPIYEMKINENYTP